MGTATIQKNTSTADNKFAQADECGFCPECGAVMNEADRLIEQGWIYIWLECSKSACDGKWLRRDLYSDVEGV